MMDRQKVKLLLWFATLLSVLALVVAPALADGVTLTVNKAGTGNGTVTSDDGKINCGAVCEATYDGDQTTRSGRLLANVVTLTAAPAAGSVFGGWGGDCTGQGLTAQVTMNADRTCTATFNLAEPVGGIAVPVNKLGLVALRLCSGQAPWLGLAALAGLAALGVALVRRRGD